MLALVAVKCPSCGAALRIDPALEFATCQFCNTSAFVRTTTRPVSPHARQQHAPVIDLRSVRRFVIAVSSVLVLGVLLTVAGLVADFRNHADRSRAGVTPAKVPAPAPPTPEWSPRLNVVGVEAVPAPRPETFEPAPRSAGNKSTPAKPVAGRLAVGQLTISGRLDSSVVRGVVSRNHGRMLACYEQGLGRSADLSGRVNVRFVIGRDGSVSNVTEGESSLLDASARKCILAAFFGLSFPAPPGGIVTVVYPLNLRPA